MKNCVLKGIGTAVNKRYIPSERRARGPRRKKGPQAGTLSENQLSVNKLQNFERRAPELTLIYEARF